MIRFYTGEAEPLDVHRRDRLIIDLPAFEFSKRKFAEQYGSQLPVWALLASGSTGGVGDHTAHV